MPYKCIKQMFRYVELFARFTSGYVPTSFPARQYLVLFLLFILVTHVCLAKSTADNPHHFQMYCSACHDSDTTGNEVVGPLYISINQACQS